jgi:flagellar basal body P-ring formation protein FlgA
MIRTMTRIIAPGLALGLALAAASPLAAAAQTPTLRASVTVTGDVVHIGDLIENAGAVADVPIFRAPDLGTRGAVATDRIIEAIRPHQLIDIDTGGLSEVVVTRLSRTITSQEIATRVSQSLSGHFGLGDARNVTVYFDRDVRNLQVEPDASGDLQVLNLTYDPRGGRFDVTFDLASSPSLHRAPARYTGIATETIPAVTVSHPVEHGEVLKETDLTVVRRPKSEAGVLTDMAAVVGLAARHQLRPEQTLHAVDLMKPEIVARNDMVTIVYQAPGITLTLRGQAQESGALGDTIGVLNVESKRIVQGVISAPGRISVGGATTRVVDNAPPAASQ